MDPTSIDSFQDVFKTEFESITDDAATDALRSLLDARGAIKDHRRFQRGFESRLQRTWRQAVDLFDLMRVLALEFGSDVNDRLRPAAAAKHDFVFEALSRLHGRACLTSSEIGALLKTGHATGANARWRTLHELAIVALFVRQHGQETARRYLEYQAIETYRAAIEYQRYCQVLGYEPADNEEIEQLKGQRDRLISKYGANYGERNGWASHALGTKGPTFARIAEAVDMQHWSPYVSMAHYGVHAGPRGGFFDLGLHSDIQAIPAGPSQFGLADPGGNSLISLVLVTVAYLAHALSLEREDSQFIAEGAILITQMKILQSLLDQGVQAFSDIHGLQEESTAELGEPPRIWLTPKLDG